MTETCRVSRKRLDALAHTFMDICRDKTHGLREHNLDEFLKEYHLVLGHYDVILGKAILGLFPEYGGENDPD